MYKKGRSIKYMHNMCIKYRHSMCIKYIQHVYNVVHMYLDRTLELVAPSI